MARLIESSLWVNFTRKRTPPAVKAQIQPWILDPAACLCELVAFEVLRHATDQERPLIEAQFATLPLLPTPARLWQNATRLGQTCGKNGFNAGSLDLLIAALAIHHGAELITFDKDYTTIAQHSPLMIQHLKRTNI
jgi:predicted nucleic acid-binding protein